MKPKSVSYHVGDGQWQELKWDEKNRRYISADGTISVAKPKTEDGKETTVRAQWGDSEYAVTCTPGYDPTLCSIYDPSKGQGGRVEIRFGSTPPAVAAQPVAAAPAAAPPPAPPAAAPSSQPTPAAAASGGTQLTKEELGKKVASWIFRDYPPNERGKALVKMRKIFNDFSGKHTPAEAEAKYAAARNPATAEPQARPVRDDRAPASRPSAAAPPSTTPSEVLTGKALGQHVATWVHAHYKDDVKGPMFHLTELRGRLSHGDKKGFYSVRTNPRALDAFLNAYLTAFPSTPKPRPNLGEYRGIHLGAPRESAKGAATKPPAEGRKAEAARKVAEARAEKVRVAAEAKAAALEKQKAALAQKAEVRAEAKRKAEEAKQAAANQKIQDAAAKAAERDQKIFEVAKTVLERVTEIGKMPSADVAKIAADELSTLYRGIKDYNKGDKVYDAARAQLISLSKQKAQSIVDGLKQKQATVEMIAKEGPDSTRKLWRAMAEFRSLYQTAKHDLKTLEALEPQTAHHKEITAINATINRVRVADIRGEERKMRSELAKVTSALERIRNQMPKSAADSEKMAVLYKVAEEMATATENLDAFRKQHKDQLPKEVALIEGQRSNLAERLQGLQAPLIVEIRKYPGKMPQVENFDDPSQYGWITDESPSPDGKLRDVQVKYAKALIDAAQKLLGPDPKKWDDAVIVDPDSRNVEIWKNYWKTAHTAIHLVDEFKKTGKTPALVPAAKPIDVRTPAEKVRDAAAEAAKAAIAAKEKIAHDRFEPIRKNLQSQIDWVNGVHMKLLDDYGRPRLPAPPVKQLEEFETKLKTIQATLSTFDVDESGMSREDIHVTEELRSNAVLVLGLIAKLLTYIDKAKTAPTEPARAVVGADVKPVPAPAISESDAQKTPDQFQEELGSKGLLIAGAETDPRKISEVEEHKKRVTQILEAARQRAKEPGMQEVIRAAENVLKRANSKIRELGGTVPSAPPLKATPLPAPVAPPPDAVKPDPTSELEDVKEAQRYLKEADVKFSKFNRNIKDQSFAALVKLYQDTLDVTVGFAPSADELKGKSRAYVDIAAQSKVFNKKASDLARQVYAEIQTRLSKRLSDMGLVKSHAEDAVKALDAKGLNTAKETMRKLHVDAKAELTEFGKIEDDKAALSKRISVVDGLATAVEKMVISSDALRGKGFKQALSEIDGLRRDLGEIEARLQRDTSASQLDDAERAITKGIKRLKEIAKNDDVAPQAKGAIAAFEGTLGKITALRETQKTAKKYDELRSQVTALLINAETLKDNTLDVTALEANQKALEVIKSKLQAFNKDIPETDATRNLKNQISNGIIKIDGYIAGLGNAISVKRATQAVPTEEARPQSSSLDQVEKDVARIDKEYAAALKLTTSSSKIEKLRELYDQAEAIRQKLLSIKGDITDAKLLAKFDIIYQRVNALTQNIYTSKYQIETGLGVTLLPQLQGHDDYKSLKLGVDEGEHAITCDDLTEAQAAELAPKLASSIGMQSSTPISLILILTKGGASPDPIRGSLEREGFRKTLTYNDPATSKQPVVQLRFILDSAAAERVKKKYAGIEAATEHARSEAEKVRLRQQAAEIERKQSVLNRSVSAMGSRLVEGHVQIMSEDKATDLHLQAFRIPLKAPSNDLSNAAKAAFIEKQLASIKPQLAQIRTLTGCTPSRPLLILSNHKDDDDSLIPNAFEPKGEGKSKAKGSTRSYSVTRGQNGYIYVIVPAFDETTSVDGYYDGMSKKVPSFSALEALINQADHPGKGQARAVAPTPEPEAQPALGPIEIIRDPIKLPKVHQTPQVRDKMLKSGFGLKNTQAAVYQGEVDPASLKNPTILQERITNIMKHAKSLDMDHVLILYRGTSKETRLNNYQKFEDIVRQVDPELKFLRPRRIEGESIADGENDFVHYIVIRDSSLEDDAITRKHEAYLRKAMKEAH